MDWASFFIGLLPSIIAGVAVFYISRNQRRRDEAVEKISNARKCEALLSLEMQMSSNKLAYACAMALKRGEANGEVEDGIRSYEASKQKYTDFMAKQATEHIMGGD